MDFYLLLSVRYNHLLSDLALRDVMLSKAKVNKERKNEDIIKNVHYQNGTNDSTAA